MTTSLPPPAPPLPLGRVFITPGAQALLQAAGQLPAVFLHRHQTGDYGDLDAEDLAANRQALRDGARLLSAYTVGQGRIWIITEADRATTTLLLPEEY